MGSPDSLQPPTDPDARVDRIAEVPLAIKAAAGGVALGHLLEADRLAARIAVPLPRGTFGDVDVTMPPSGIQGNIRPPVMPVRPPIKQPRAHRRS